MDTLFRREALAARQGTWLGGIQLVRPVSLSVLTALVLVAATATVAFLGAGHYTRKARVTGYLVPDGGVIRLVPTQPASVLERRVREGQQVRAGEVLFVLSVDRATLGGDTQAAVQASLAARERSLQGTAQQREAIARRLDDMRREATQLQAETALRQQRLALAQAAQARLEALRADHFISSAQVQAKAEDVLGLQAELQALERQRAAQRREIDALEAQARELPLRAQVQQGEIERDLAALAQEAAESEARGRLVMRAPQDGVVTALTAEPGQSVGPGAALASLVPAQSRLQAQLYAPSSAVGFVRPDQPVLLRYQAYPYQKFGHQLGHVLQVSRTPLQASELAGLPLPGSVTGAAQPLAAGMQLDADVLLERRRLVEWLFEPLLGVAGRV